MTASDQAAAIAQAITETPIQRPDDGSVLTASEFIAAVVQRFPLAGVEEFRRGAAIANELFRADRAERGHFEMVNNPCDCGEPGEIVLLGADGRPDGTRRCFQCDLIEAAKTPCIACGGPMDGEDVRAGIELCGGCDLGEIGRLDDEGDA